MATVDHLGFLLTVRLAPGAEGFEYVIARKGMEAVRSEGYFATHAAARAAGNEHGRELASPAGPATPGGGRDAPA